MNRSSFSALLAFLFAGFTGWVLATEGVAGFVTSLDTAWSWQIFVDLCLAASTALVLLAPRAKAAGGRVVPWVALTLATGSIGLLAFTARVLHLERR